MDTLKTRDNIALVLRHQGRCVEAEAEHRAVLAIGKRVLGPDHRFVFEVQYNLARCLKEQKNYTEALVLAQKALEGYRKTLGRGHLQTKDAKKLVEELEQPQ